MRSLLLDDRMTVVEGRDGFFVVDLNDVFIGRSIATYGEYNRDEALFLQRLLRSGDHIIEIGANIGAHTVGLAKAVGPTGRVYAFEPQRGCYALLEAQLALNRLRNVFAYRAALGQEGKRLWLPLIDDATPNNFGGIALAQTETPGAEAVDVDTLDERFAKADRCALLKIDVEGMEEEVLRGGMALIKRTRPLLYVENDRVEKSAALIALIQAFGYRLWWHIPRLFSAENFFGVAHNFFGEVASFNMLCCPEPHAATAGLVEIKSPNDPHPLAKGPGPGGYKVNYAF